MQIEIIAVVTEAKKNSRGGIYNEAVITYKNKSFQDKIETKKILDFAAKEVYPTLSQAKFGEVFDIVRTKDEQGYWQWTGIGPGNDSNQFKAQPEGNPMNNKTPSVTPKSTYETAEERTARQVMIVRQSSLANAVSLLAANGGKKNTVEEVIAVAKQFENYVLDKTPTPDKNTNSFSDIPEDEIPF